MTLLKLKGIDKDVEGEEIGIVDTSELNGRVGRGDMCGRRTGFLWGN